MMNLCKIVSFLAFGAVLCQAQIINIKGTVKNESGAAISGAAVTLEGTNVSTVTGSDGSFTLTNQSTNVRHLNNSTPERQDKSLRFHNNTLTVSAVELSNLSIKVYNISGQLIMTSTRNISAGNYSIPLPRTSSNGLHIYRISLNNEHYTVTSVNSEIKTGSISAPLGDVKSLMKQAGTTVMFSDVIKVIKEGYLDYRMSLTNPDISGLEIKLSANAGNVTDADGNTYKSVKIGNLVWTVENFRSTKYNDGSAIPLVTENSLWSRLNIDDPGPGFCFYGNTTDAAAQRKWGALYNGRVVDRLAPSGWRVPSDADWDALANYLDQNGFSWDGTIGEGRIGKSLAAKTDWALSPGIGNIGYNLSTNNSSGFSALPGGCRNTDGSFSDQGSYGCWWGSTTTGENLRNGRNLGYGNANFIRDGGDKGNGLSIRLVRDVN